MNAARAIVCALILAATATTAASAQPGLALGDPDLAIARDSFAPFGWRGQPITTSASIVVPWYGSGSDLSADRWRTLLMIVDDEPIQGGKPLFHLRYNPALSAVEMLTVYRPKVQGREPTGGTPNDRILGSIRVTGVPLDDDRHHCAVFHFDADTGTYALHVASQGDQTVRSAELPDFVESIPRAGSRTRIFLGNPLAGNASHTGPIFPIMMRRVGLDADTLESVWNTPDGPRLTELIGPATRFDDDVVFLLMGLGTPTTSGPADDGRAHIFYEGDPRSWQGMLARRSVEGYRNGEPTDDLGTVRQTLIYEQDEPWSGWWSVGPVPANLAVGIEPVPGYLPRFHAVLNGTRVADTALTAWGLGNSRWSNTTPVAASVDDPTRLSRSHLLGLRAARPGLDGGLVVLDLEGVGRIAGLDALAPAIKIDMRSNWTRFGYGSSFAPAPGTGGPGHLDAAETFTFLSDAPPVTPGAAEPATQSLMLLLERPRGGSARLDLYTTDAQGEGAVAAASPATAPLPGTPALGGAIDTDTTRAVRTIAAVTDTTCVVEGDTSAIEPGDALVGDNDDVVNIVEAVDGQTITLRFPWTTRPDAGSTAAFGPVSYRLVGYEHDAPRTGTPRRGLRLEHTAGGRITVVGLGIRSLDPNRICYVLAGRGGLGQQQQADREAPGTLAAMVDALGVELFFTGLATQSEGTVPALEAQLGERILTHEFIGTPDVTSGQFNSFSSQSFVASHTEIADGARAYDNWAYLQIQDQFPDLHDQYMLLWRHDPAHPNGRGMLAAAELWWTRLEALADTLLTNNACPADVTRDGTLTPQDFNAWVRAYNDRAPAADQNGDARITPADFNAWLLNFSRGCP